MVEGHVTRVVEVQVLSSAHKTDEESSVFLFNFL
jgi:hypothetical protein